MTPTPAWYEADSDDSDRNVTDDITASTLQEPRGAILPASEPARGYSDAHLLRRRTAALNRTSAENERLRAEVERLRGFSDNAMREWHREVGDRMEAELRAEAAEAKLRDVEAFAACLRAEAAEVDDQSHAVPLTYRHIAAQLADVLARSQAQS